MIKYTKEDHLMYLLSGGDREFDIYYIDIGPISPYPLLLDEVNDFVRQVNEVSGEDYYIPTRDLIDHLIRVGHIEEMSYWSFDVFNEILCSPKRLIDADPYVLLVIHKFPQNDLQYE